MKYRLRVMPEWSSFPVWMRGGMVDPDNFPISEALRRDLQTWNDDFTDTGGVAPDGYERPPEWDPEPFRERGRVLAQRLVAELGPETEVTVELWDG